MNKQEFLQTYTIKLNEQQCRAVQSVNGPVLLLAVPGSGKTTVLVNRLGYMLLCEEIDPRKILTLTYTIAATADMSRRFESLFGSEFSDVLEFRTINGICSKIIQRYGMMIGKEPFSLITDEKATSKIVADILVNHLDDYPTESEIKLAKTLITYCKNMLLEDKEIEKLEKDAKIPVLEIFKEYNAYLRKNRLMDYDDQMIYANNMLNKSPELLKYYRNMYQYICVDEAQDTSKIQHMIINLLAGVNGNLFMVGDEDQSIYGFRAAYPEALLEFKNIHPKAQILVMDKNYRSNANIVKAADEFIQRNRYRYEKHIVPTRDPDTDVSFINLKGRSNQYNYLLKVVRDCKRETAVLYRENESVIPLIDLLDRNNLSYRVKNIDMSFFTHRIVTDIISFMKLAINPYDTDSFLKIYYKCETYLRKNQANELCKISQERNIPVLEARRYLKSINGRVGGKCAGLQSHLNNMLSETPSKALFRILKRLGYSDFLKRNNINDNKTFILQMLSYQEKTIDGFLNRIDYLNDLLQNSVIDYDSKFILSTIHSSKGLEYDQVYLLDICDGVFPLEDVTRGGKKEQIENKEFEEERRVFYVGMTRAKNNLFIFKCEDSPSCFIKELQTPISAKMNQEDEKKKSKKTEKQDQDAYSTKDSIKKTKQPRMIATVHRKEEYISDYELEVGERVIHKTEGSGTVIDVQKNENGKVYQFKVEFDSGIEKEFAFPLAFKLVMKLASGVKVDIQNVIKTERVNIGAPFEKQIYNPVSYGYYVHIKREDYFWNCHGKDAEIVNQITGYELYQNSKGIKSTGCPKLENITDKLKEYRIKYIVVLKGEIIEKQDFL